MTLVLRKRLKIYPKAYLDVPSKSEENRKIYHVTLGNRITVATQTLTHVHRPLSNYTSLTFYFNLCLLFLVSSFVLLLTSILDTVDQCSCKNRCLMIVKLESKRGWV